MGQDIDTALVLRLEASLAKLEKQMARARAVVNDSSARMEGRFGDLNKRMAKSAEQAAAALVSGLDRVDDGYKSVLHAVDPVAAASARLAAQEMKLADALKYGSISAEEHARVLALLRSQYGMVAPAAMGAQRGMAGMTNISNSGRFVLQNTAAQIGDIAVQLEMGTSASRVMAQQLPQLLGGFGALGGTLGLVAPLLGVVAAVGIPIAAMLFSMGGEAEKTKEKVTSFADKLEHANAALGRARDAARLVGTGGLDDLREKYGKVTIAVVNLVKELAELEARASKVEVEAVLDETFSVKLASQIDKAFGGVSGDIVRNMRDQIPALEQQIAQLQKVIDYAALGGNEPASFYTDAIVALREQLALAKGDVAGAASLMADIKLDPALLQQVSDLKLGLEAAVKAGDFWAVGDAAAEMLRLMRETGVVLDDDVVNALRNAESLARTTSADLDRAKAAAEGVAGAAGGAADNISWAAGEAGRMAANLRDAAGALASIAGGIASLNLSNIGDRARVAAMEQGLSRSRANTAGRLAEEQARLAPALGSGDAAIRAVAKAELAKLESGLAEQEQLEARLTELGKASSESGRSGKGAGGGDTSKIWDMGEADIQALQRQIDMIGRTKAEVAELTLKHKLLDEAKKNGLSLDSAVAGSNRTVRDEIDARAASIRNLTEEYDRAQISQQQFDQGVDDIADAMAGALIKGESFRESMAEIFRNIAFDILKSGIKEAIMSSFSSAGRGGGGGFLGSVFKGLTGGLSFDGGGSTGTGPRSGGLDGKGGFLAMMHPKETVIDHTKGQTAGGGPSTMNINVNVEGANGDQHVIDLVQQGVTKGLRQVPNIMAENNKRR